MFFCSVYFNGGICNSAAVAVASIEQNAKQQKEPLIPVLFSISLSYHLTFYFIFKRVLFIKSLLAVNNNNNTTKTTSSTTL